MNSPTAPLRILHVTDSWGPGGAETVFVDLAAGLDRSRAESWAGLPRSTGWLSEEVTRRGIAARIFPSNGSFDLGHVRRVSAVVQAQQIDLIQAHTFGTSVYASLVGMRTKRPVVCTLHGRVDLALNERYRRIKWRIIRNGAARVVCVSTALRAELLRTTPAMMPHAVDVIYNGVDAVQFAPGRNDALRRALGVGDNEILIGAVGNIRRIKGYEVLIDAAAFLSKLAIPYKIVIAGLPVADVQAELEAHIAAIGVSPDRVRFLGFRADAAELYRAFDIYALTSHSEGFPLSAIQAMASGLPVVATRCGGPEEMVEDGRTGYLVTRGSGPEVGSALARLAADPQMRVRMGTAAREAAAERFSIRAMASQYEALYTSLVR